MPTSTQTTVQTDSSLSIESTIYKLAKPLVLFKENRFNKVFKRKPNEIDFNSTFFVSNGLHELLVYNKFKLPCEGKSKTETLSNLLDCCVGQFKDTNEIILRTMIDFEPWYAELKYTLKNDKDVDTFLKFVSNRCHIITGDEANEIMKAMIISIKLEQMMKFQDV